ncbi:hypothetical protein SAMN04487968_10665 [Nocardioides terrae]|uniref:WD40-like Beta Propeller Repeat n=1 Tax=Nocardioides terrae TaxID=574651 RepID=A0A1I1IT67_9ACTN|nr:hypothetical protein [Nocardioides terrae]SFC39416.1 hypothetical protein SAMN04487968_10665 [Nocardioides terrae]
MTERLSALLHDEALDVPVPAAPAEAIIAGGRRTRVRRRLGAGAVSAAAAAAVAAVCLMPSDGSGLRLAPDPAAASPLDPAGWAVSAGSTLYLGNGATAQLPDKVKSIYYTSAGTVVRTGTVAYTDAPDSAYALVGDDGRVHSLGLALGDRAPSTDPRLPYLAYAQRRGNTGHDAWDVVLRDVRSGDVAVSVPVDGSFTWGGWNAPPVALDGDHVYVGLDDATLDVDWRTGAVSTASHLPAARFPESTSGRVALENRSGQPVRVAEVSTGASVAELSPGGGPGEGPAAVSISPDGRFALLVPWRTCDDDNACVYDQPASEVLQLDGGRSATVDLGDQVGWTPDGRLIRVTGQGVDLCSPVTAVCDPTGIRLGEGPVKVGGNSYES